MTVFEQRIESAVKGSAAESVWQRLIRLFEGDREAFYMLACDPNDQTLGDIADLARFVCQAVRDTYSIVDSPSGPLVQTPSGASRALPRNLETAVARFLKEVDGKATASVSGRDYVGREASEAEVRFKLGETTEWERDAESLKSRAASTPFVLRLPQDELELLASQPPYATYELLRCARSTVLSPTSVFKGLKRGDGGTQELNTGWAFCGKPKLAYDNIGQPFPTPSGLVHVVYANKDGDVFDWDWVKEDPDDHGFPLDWRMRFDEHVPFEREALLDLSPTLTPGRFDATVACYSSRGDCIFCYMSDAVSRADRINADLTVFYSLDQNKPTGFKIKNVRRILERDRDIVIDDADDITVSVQSVLLASLKHADASVMLYEVLIEALHKATAGRPNVRIPREPAVLAC